MASVWSLEREHSFFYFPILSRPPPYTVREADAICDGLAPTHLLIQPGDAQTQSSLAVSSPLATVQPTPSPLLDQRF